MMASARLPSNKRMRLRNARAASNPGERYATLAQPSSNNPTHTFHREVVEELSTNRRDPRARKASRVPPDSNPGSAFSSSRKPAFQGQCLEKTSLHSQKQKRRIPDFWSKCDIPVEIFEIIAISLSRDDLLRMRLVNRDFEKKISAHVFRTVIVPFRPNIYGMVDKEIGRTGMKVGNSRAEARPHNDKVSDGSTLDGMNIFRSWGSGIRKFALAFDLDEEVFFNLPAKDHFERRLSFWGEYKWLREEYTRYTSCEEKEKKADESHGMASALSHLTALDEFAVTVDSGLGWMPGPDCSDRAILFHEKPRIFGSSYSVMDDATAQRQRTWRTLMDEANGNINKRRIDNNLKEVVGATTFQSCHHLMTAWYMTTAHPVMAPLIRWAMVPVQENDLPLLFRGLNLETSIRSTVPEVPSCPADNLMPFSLCASQIEWLMENEWAQSAFLSSLTMAITDNSKVFQNVKILNLARVSSRYLPAFSGEALWASLPNLHTLKVFVIPDWRDIGRDANGLAVAPRILPSSAVNQFFRFLQDCIADMESIKTLEIGWLGGGERATGMFARNRHILPAPVLNILRPEMASLPFVALKLPHIEHLTLSNCWFHPIAFRAWIRGMPSMQTLSLDSVSYTASAGPGRNDPLAFGPNPNMLPLSPPRNKNVLKALDEFHEYAIGPALPAHSSRSAAPPGGHLQQFDVYRQHTPRESLAFTPRKGSWAETIDKITPGRTIAQQRSILINGPHNIPAPTPNPHPYPAALKRISFTSCGYVRLQNHRTLIQDEICNVMEKVPRCLRHRYQILWGIMMHDDNDELLGWIAPDMQAQEKGILEHAFGMRMGWGEDDESRFEAREDGQPWGGSGRFSGVVERGGV